MQRRFFCTSVILLIYHAKFQIFETNKTINQNQSKSLISQYCEHQPLEIKNFEEYFVNFWFYLDQTQSNDRNALGHTLLFILLIRANSRCIALDSTSLMHFMVVNFEFFCSFYTSIKGKKNGGNEVQINKKYIANKPVALYGG